jgi:acetate kinase
LLYRKSGLLGLSGISADMRDLLASPKPEAREAIDYYCYSAARHAAALVPAMGGLDSVVFTGGVGENAAPVREKILAYLASFGLRREQVHVVPANEELTIARHVMDVLSRLRERTLGHR